MTVATPRRARNDNRLELGMTTAVARHGYEETQLAKRSQFRRSRGRI